jgi:hypothetical protein
MSLHPLYLVGALFTTAVPLITGAAFAASGVQPGDRARQAESVTYACPSGYYWEPDAYAPHGKFRPAHCAPRW